MSQLEVNEVQIKNILTKATSGFLLNENGKGAVCSHSVQPYAGCTSGNCLCGEFCYAKWIWYVTGGRPWGKFLDVRVNAAESYLENYQSQRRWARKHRDEFSIFCSSATDPFLSHEFKFGVTRSILEAMLVCPPDRLILQTHTHRVLRYLDLFKRLRDHCPIRFHITVETDRETNELRSLLGENIPAHTSPVAKRLDACRQLKELGFTVVATVAPVIPMRSPQTFFNVLAKRTDAVVLDHFIFGDGTPDGKKTFKTRLPEWMEKLQPGSTKLSFRDAMIETARREMPGRVGVSADGFAGFYE